MRSVFFQEIEEAVGKSGIDYRIYGNKEISLVGFASLKRVSEERKLFWVKKTSNSFGVDKVRNSVVITPCEMLLEESNLQVVCTNPKMMFFFLIETLWPEKEKIGISKSAIVNTLDIGRNVFVGDNTYIGENVRIGDGSKIEHNVTIMNRVVIGENVHIHSGVRIGEDGMAVYIDKQGRRKKAHQYGGVQIGNNVEIMANACVNRGTIDDTIIADNVVIGSCSVIGHNVEIGNQTLIGSATSISGSTHIAENVYVAPGASISNQISIEKDCFICLGATVTKSMGASSVALPDNRVVSVQGIAEYFFSKNGL